MNLNKIFILGHVAADPENRMLPSGRALTTFRVATNRIWNDDAGNRQEAAEFHRIVTFGKLADVASRYLAKGQLVFVEGRLQTRSWQAKDGAKRYQTEIVAEGFQLGPRTAAQMASAHGAAVSPKPLPAEPIASPAAGPPESSEAIPVVDLDAEEDLPDDEGQKIRPGDLPF